MKEVCVNHGQQVPGLQILGLQAVKRLTVLKMGMEEEGGVNHPHRGLIRSPSSTLAPAPFFPSLVSAEEKDQGLM